MTTQERLGMKEQEKENKLLGNNAKLFMVYQNVVVAAKSNIRRCVKGVWECFSDTLFVVMGGLDVF